MNLKRSYGFRLELKQGLLKVDIEELILNNREEIAIRITLAEDSGIDRPRISVTANSRVVIEAKQLSIVRQRIPVRLIQYSVKLKKGAIVLAFSVQRLVSRIQHKPVKKIPKAITSLDLNNGKKYNQHRRFYRQTARRLPLVKRIEDERISKDIH